MQLQKVSAIEHVLRDKNTVGLMQDVFNTCPFHTLIFLHTHFLKQHYLNFVSYMKGTLKFLV